MKDCFICFDNILHGVLFNCKHEICIYCFMKLNVNLCPYCRSTIFLPEITHYSEHIPPFLKTICKSKDIFSYVLLQIYHTNIDLFTSKFLINDIKQWCMHSYIKKLYINEIRILFKKIHPEQLQSFILLFNLGFFSYLIKDNVIILKGRIEDKIIVLYPVFLLIIGFIILYAIYLIGQYNQIGNFQFRQRKLIKIENIME